ncbi:hypothetical protein ANAEL_05371 [Anaerolineales bacterium]|nr:hypothetical protein ANAEL_05371 [Anaerolineales bacterium]
MKPEKLFNLISGITLIAIGTLVLVGNVFLSTKTWKLWPLIILLGGIGLTLPGFFGFWRRGYGSFFIPGLPVLTTGAILLFASLTDNWEVWSVAWTLEVLALALGFALSAFFMRVPELAVPAFIVGVNGLMLAFCALTGLWQSWAILWPIEFLAVGLGLLALGIANGSAGVKTAASILFTIAGGGFFISTFISAFNKGILKFAVPAMLLITGILLTATFLMNKSPETPVITEQPAQES